MKQSETIAEKGWSMATALAASQPSHLGHPTIPPMDWHQEGEILTVIMADGRKVSASIPEITALMFEGVGANGVRPDYDHPSKVGSEEKSKAKPVSTPSKKVVKK